MFMQWKLVVYKDYLMSIQQAKQHEICLLPCCTSIPLTHEQTHGSAVESFPGSLSFHIVCFTITSTPCVVFTHDFLLGVSCVSMQ